MKIETKTLIITTSLLLFVLIMPSGKASRKSCLAQGIEKMGIGETRDVDARNVEPRDIEIDIKPGICPNPLNVKSHATLAVAILGTEDLDVSSIDPKSIRLEGVAPIRYWRKDVSTSIADRMDVCDCTIEGKDGVDDLVMIFDIPKVVSTLEDVFDGDVAVLTVSGKLLNGTPIEGEDCVSIEKYSSIEPE